ncbi:hypothetical protein DACRYDRAFT_24044 [Dacryopinax primogenitus]|uniref:Copper acquisition factor BIM1-like domain-containing protein n=1 Tax=Dacryopinax primogenitus (strain DJM 731) TaxID=1858805 RepID=M5G5A1_DACPD|nr:uncharacterized protein DACRYDRAFT_24044 [Dacryopinax primogenitus]EJT98932.1 hypothetical protein DACRYDRAFT_24044 [Dacryopinax primogenitus]
MFSPAAFLLLGAVPALAHFHLNYPPPRGPFVAQNELSFCSSYPLGPRAPFSIDQGIVDITSSHPSASVEIVISFDQNPTTFAQFNATDNGTAYAPLLPTFAMTYQGELCVPVDAATVGVPVVNGTNATIQVYFNGGDGLLYDCADVVLISNYTLPSNTTCKNSTVTPAPSNSTNSTTSGSGGTSAAVPLKPVAGLGLALLAAVGLALGLSV